MFIAELFEGAAEGILVVYPGRFQPFHKGHKAVYDWLVKKFGRDNVFIATSNKVEPPKSPFNFNEKAQFMALTGVSMDRVVESVQPYKALELTSRYNPQNTRLIFAVSEKDMAEDPRFKSWTKKDGTPAYFQPMPKDMAEMHSLDRHGYILTVPTFDFTVLGTPMRSASQVRETFTNLDPDRQREFVKDLFGNYNDAVMHVLQTKLVK